MYVEVVRAVNVERRACDAFVHHRRDVRALAVGVDLVGAYAGEKFRYLYEVCARLRRGLLRETEARGTKDAGVRLDGEHVAGEFRLVRVAVGDASARAVLLVRKQHDADRSARTKAQLFEQTHGLPRGDDASAVVLRARAHVPRINVAADDYDLVGLLSTFEFGDDVCRLGVGQKVRTHLEVKPRVLAALLHSL